jgi:hypothetical protein
LICLRPGCLGTTPGSRFRGSWFGSIGLHDAIPGHIGPLGSVGRSSVALTGQNKRAIARMTMRMITKTGRRRRAADIEFSENRRASRLACSGRPKTQGGSKGSPTGTLDRPHESRKIPLVPQSKLLCEPKVAQESHSHSEAQRILCWLSRLRGRAVQRSAPDSLSLGRFRFVCRNKLDV